MQRKTIAAATRTALEMRDFKEAARVFARIRDDRRAATSSRPRWRCWPAASPKARARWTRRSSPMSGPSATRVAGRRRGALPLAGGPPRRPARSARDQAIDELEGLTVLWRGDRTEVEALDLLGRLYVDANRYRDALPHAGGGDDRAPDVRRHPRAAADHGRTPSPTCSWSSAATSCRRWRRSASSTTIRELVPVGRRGDEMIRRLADRLISVDLLDQAANSCSIRSTSACRARRGRRSPPSWRWCS